MSYNQNVGGGIEFNDMIHTFVLKNIPAFKDESHITSVNDYIKKMNFQMSKINRPSGGSEEIMTSWPELNDALLSHKNFGKYIKKAKKYCKKILKSELKIADLSSKETSKNIIQYVKDNFTWNYFDSKYTSQSAKSFYENKRGNSADINLFLLALLREAGIECKPVILSTRNHGKINVDFLFLKLNPTHRFQQTIINTIISIWASINKKQIKVQFNSTYSNNYKFPTVTLEH